MLYEVWQVWFYFDNMFFFFFSWRELEVVNNKESTQLKAQLFRFNSKFLKRKKKEKRKIYSFPMSKVQYLPFATATQCYGRINFNLLSLRWF